MKAVISSHAAYDTPVGRDGVTFALLFSIVAVVIIAPLAIIDTPMLADYPNHVARMHIIGNIDAEEILAMRYIASFDLLPNIAMDLAVPALARILPLDVAGRLFLALCLLSSLASIAWLHRTLFGRWSAYPLIAALFAHHGSLIAGLVNFSLGIGLVPAALAVWIRIRHAPAPTRFLIGSAMTLALYFCHLVALGAYGLLVIGYEWARARDKWSRRDGPGRAARDMGIGGATGVLPLLLFLWLIRDDATGPTQAGLVFGNLAWKLKALLAPLANYNLPLDLASFALLILLLFITWRAGWLEVERRMAPGLALLATAVLLAPKALWTGGVFDQRLAVLFAPMVVACTRFTSPGGMIGRLLPVVLASLLIVRVGALTSTWLDHRTDLAEMREAIRKITPGGRILVIQPDKTAGLRLAPPRHIVFHHAAQLASLPTLAVVEKNAFVSTLYAIPGQQPLALKPPFDRLGGRGHADLPTLDDLEAALGTRAKNGPPARPQIESWPEDFDYVLLLYGYGPGAEDLVGDLPLTKLLDGKILDLFRIERG